MSRLIHYSREPLMLDRRRSYGPSSREDKPRGLWVSAEGVDDWEAWCRSESFNLEGLACRAEIVLDPGARTLNITTALDIDLFDQQFGKNVKWRRGIEWDAVAKHYDAIVIAPYQWSRRLSGGCAWYYGWDCASGCIWNLDAIAECRPLEYAAALAAKGGAR